MISYSQYKPSENLKEYIDCFWVLQSTQSEFKPLERLIPDGKIEIIFNFKNPYKKVIGENRHNPETLKGAQLIGQRQELYLIQQEGNIYLLGIRFTTAGLFPFFNIPLQEFTDTTLNLQYLIGRQLSEIEERLMEATSFSEQKQILESLFISKLNQSQYCYTRFTQTLLTVGNLSGNSIENMAHHLNTTYKNLERDFAKFTGLSPKRFVKISRFNAALKSLYACDNKSLTQVALDNGYYDQSHFIRDFKHFTGLSPKEFLAEQHSISEMLVQH